MRIRKSETDPAKPMAKPCAKDSYDPVTGKDPDIDPPLSYAEQHAVHFVSQLMKDKKEHYPFDQCVLDRQKDGYSVEAAKRICGAIKAGNIVHKNNLTVTKNEDGSVSWELEVTLIKSTSEQTVHGVVYEPNTVDSQGDFADEDEIRKACHDFMTNSKTLGIMHKEAAGPRASIVENYIAPHAMQVGNQQIKKGTWMMGVKVHDPELWDKVQKGEITGFSMGGRAEADSQ